MRCSFTGFPYKLGFSTQRDNVTVVGRSLVGRRFARLEACFCWTLFVFSVSVQSTQTKAPCKTRDLKKSRVDSLNVTRKTTQRAARMPWHRARSRMRSTHSELWWTGKSDPRSVPATIPWCPDKGRKFRTHGTKSVVSQHMTVCTPMGPLFFRLIHTMYKCVV